MHAVVQLILFFQSAENSNGVFRRRLVYEHRLNASRDLGRPLAAGEVVVDLASGDGVLAARLAARRAVPEQAEQTVLSVGDLRMNLLTREVTRAGQRIDLQNKDGSRQLVVAAIKRCETMQFGQFIAAYFRRYEGVRAFIEEKDNRPRWTPPRRGAAPPAPRPRRPRW